MHDSHPLAKRFSRRHALIAAGAAAFVAFVPRRVFAGTADAAWQPFVGSFGFAGGAKEREALDAAIEDAVADMNILARAVARDRLKSSNAIGKNGRISCDGKALSIVVDEHDFTAPLDGSAVKVAVSGDDYDLKYHVSEGSIVQTFTSKDGGRVNTLSLHDDRLSMRVRVYSPSLPKDLKYTLTYKRK